MIKKIKVLECIRQGNIGGGETHLLSLVENLDKSLFEPIVLSFTDGPMIEKLKSQGIKTVVIHTRTPFDFTKWHKVRKLLMEEQIDVVHAHGTRANSNVFWAARSLNLPVIYTVHAWSFHDDQAAWIKKVRIWSEKYLTARMNVNISVSESNKQSGKKYINKFNSVVINNGIDHTKFAPARAYKNIRKELGLCPEAIVVLFIARFTMHKQPLMLIRAFAEAVKQLPQLKLLMVGDGDEKQKALQLVKNLGIEKTVCFQAFRNDVPDILASADIFVLPSLWEGLPIGLLEAMAMGKAVIGTRVDGTREVIQHNVNGLLVEVNDMPEKLTEALVRLGSDSDLRNKIREKAIETVRSRFNVTYMTRQIEKVYKDLVV
jgi:glycosyltransferase involved in cell wall biosynthesis